MTFEIKRQKRFSHFSIFNAKPVKNDYFLIVLTMQTSQTQQMLQLAAAAIKRLKSNIVSSFTYPHLLSHMREKKNILYN